MSDLDVSPTAKSGVGLRFTVHTFMDVLVGPPRGILDGGVKDFYTLNPGVRLYPSTDDLIGAIQI